MNKIITQEKSIISCDDIELNHQRAQKLLFKYSYPKDKKIKGIVFNIHGFGADLAYMDNLREFSAKEFSVVAVDVYYHCFFSRENNGANIEFDKIDLLILQDIIDTYKIDFSNVKEITTDSVLNNLKEQIQKLKINHILENNFRLQLPITIVPKNNEYQNFGIMQAIDHINVLLELEKMPFDFIEHYPIILLGSSHGGYLAHLITKLAPHKIDCVIDNSCYVKPPLNYIVGKETNILKPEIRVSFENISLNCFVQTLWTTNHKSPNHFSNNHYRIRDLNDSVHISKLPNFTSNKIKFISYHSTSDGIANVDDKISLYEELNNLGFDATLHIIDNSTQIDGKFIKTLSHGMDMSLKELSKRELPKALSIKKLNNIKDNSVIYQCDSNLYQLVYKNNILLSVDINAVSKESL